MEYSFLGKSGLKLSKLVLGCANFGEGTSEEEAEKIILAAVDAGINIFDTANVYPNQGLEGRSETIVGQILKKHKLCDKLISASKVRARMGAQLNNSGLSRKHIKKQIDETLKRLNLNTLDLYQLHRPDLNTSFEDTILTINDLIKSGQIHYWGVSDFSPSQVIEMLWFCEKYKVPSCSSIQIKYNLLARQPEYELLSLCEKYSIAVFAYSPLEGGLLTGKYLDSRNKPENARHHIWNMDFNTPGAQRRTHQISQLLSLAKELKMNLVQLSLWWIINNPLITSCIIGPKTLSQFNDYLSVFDISPGTYTLDRINEICPPCLPWQPSTNSMFR